MDYNIKLGDYWQLIETDKYADYSSKAAAAVAVDQVKDLAYIYGGFTNDNQTPGDLHIFNMKTYQIELIDCLENQGRINHKMFLLKNDRLCIIGGVKNINDSERPQFCDDLIIYNIKMRKIEDRISFNGKMKRVQFEATYGYKNNEIYIYGGSNTSDFFKISMGDFSITDINPRGDLLLKRTGHVMEYLPDGTIFIFSGFLHENGYSICHNDFSIYDIKADSIVIGGCTEQIGRSFSKAVVDRSKNRVLIAGGTINGMESSGSIYFYDYKEKRFNIVYIDAFPERGEPAVFLSDKQKKVFISGGVISKDVTGFEVLNEIFILDLNKISEASWTGHP